MLLAIFIWYFIYFIFTNVLILNIGGTFDKHLGFTRGLTELHQQHEVNIYVISELRILVICSCMSWNGIAIYLKPEFTLIKNILHFVMPNKIWYAVNKQACVENESLYFPTISADAWSDWSVRSHGNHMTMQTRWWMNKMNAKCCVFRRILNVYMTLNCRILHL